MDVCGRTDADMNVEEDFDNEWMYMNLQWIRREMQTIELTIRDLSKFTTQLIYTLDKCRVKRDPEENVAQDDDSAKDEIDYSSLAFLPVPYSQHVIDDQRACWES